MAKKVPSTTRGNREPAVHGQAQPQAVSDTKRVPATDEKAADVEQLRQPNERDESADQQKTATRSVIKQAHDDVQSGQQDTDARNRVAEVLPDVPKTPKNFDEGNAVDQSPRVQKKNQP